MEKILFISLIISCCSALPSPPLTMFDKIEVCPTIINFVHNSTHLAKCKSVENPEVKKPLKDDPQHKDLVMCVSVYAVMHKICSDNSQMGIFDHLEYKVPKTSSEFDSELKSLKPENEEEYVKQLEKICGNILLTLNKVNTLTDANDPESSYMKEAVESLFSNKDKCNIHCYHDSEILDSRCLVLYWASNLFKSTKPPKPAAAPPVNKNLPTKTEKIEEKLVDAKSPEIKPKEKEANKKTPEIKPKEKEVNAPQNPPVTQPKVKEKNIPDAEPQAPEPVKPVVDTEKEKKVNEEVNNEKTMVENEKFDNPDSIEEVNIGGSNQDEVIDQNVPEKEPIKNSTPENKDHQQNSLPQDFGDKSPLYSQLEKEKEESHFFTYFWIICFLFIGFCLGYHNKQKILAIALEGRRGSRRGRGARRRPSTANYRKLDSNLEEAVTSQCSSNATHVIY